MRFYTQQHQYHCGIDLHRDSDGVEWECRWMRLDGYTIPKTTRVRLRPPGSDIDTPLCGRAVDGRHLRAGAN